MEPERFGEGFDPPPYSFGAPLVAALSRDSLPASRSVCLSVSGGRLRLRRQILTKTCTLPRGVFGIPILMQELRGWCKGGFKGGAFKEGKEAVLF